VGGSISLFFVPRFVVPPFRRRDAHTAGAPYFFLSSTVAYALACTASAVLRKPRWSPPHGVPALLTSAVAFGLLQDDVYLEANPDRREEPLVGACAGMCARSSQGSTTQSCVYAEENGRVRDRQFSRDPPRHADTQTTKKASDADTAKVGRHRPVR